MWLSALKWTNSGATSVLNHVSAGCFTRMTGYGGRLWRTYSVNARWPRWSVFWPAVGLWGRGMDDGWLAAVWITPEGKLHVISKRYTQRLSGITWIWGSIWQGWAEVTVVLKIGGAAWQSHRALSEHKTLSVSWAALPICRWANSSGFWVFIVDYKAVIW
jgi:hypothetical protein